MLNELLSFIGLNIDDIVLSDDVVFSILSLFVLFSISEVFRLFEYVVDRLTRKR